MWWLLKIVVFVVLLVVLVLVAIGNDATVDLDLLVWKIPGVRLFLVMFGAALFGFLAGLALLGVREIQWRLSTSKRLRSEAQLQREVDELRRAPLSGLDDPPAVGHGSPGSGNRAS